MPLTKLNGWNEWGDYHDKGDIVCFACVISPVRCECGGLSHIQIAEDNLDASESLCDTCNSYNRYALEASAANG